MWIRHITLVLLFCINLIHCNTRKNHFFNNRNYTLIFIIKTLFGHGLMEVSHQIQHMGHFERKTQIIILVQGTSVRIGQMKKETFGCLVMENMQLEADTEIVKSF